MKFLNLAKSKQSKSVENKTSNKKFHSSCITGNSMETKIGIFQILAFLTQGNRFKIYTVTIQSITPWSVYPPPCCPKFYLQNHHILGLSPECYPYANHETSQVSTSNKLI